MRPSRYESQRLLSDGRSAVSGGWLDIEERGGVHREVLRDGLTRVGGTGADIVLPGAVDGELHLWNRPPRAIFVGRGPRPKKAGVPFEESELRPGDAIEWAGVVLRYGGEAASADQAALEELPASGDEARPRELADELAAGARRVLAGLACDLGLVDPASVRAWQQAVLEQRFDPEACARELLPPVLAPEVRQRLLDRSGTLLRDFVMAPFASGSRAARRRLRHVTRSTLAFLVAQGLALLAFVLIVLAAMLVLRSRGFSFDELLDRVLPG